MGCRIIVSIIGYAASCCSKIKNKALFFKKNDDMDVYKQDIDLKDDGHHLSNILNINLNQ